MSKKMNTKILGISACLLIFVLDIIALVFAIKAKEAQNHGKHMRMWIFECKVRSHDAFMLGVAAAVFLSAAHIFVNLLGWLVVTGRDDSQKPSKKFSKVFFVLIWIIYGVGLTLLLIGTRSNEKKGISCGFTYHNFLPTGGILCVVHAILALAFYALS
ncbi:protein DESIGUAL 3-like [Salvia hispanica]|uniref:protein DESIGUAL 3-like n=1 Tax=Salvia hispanica TaxID=49212 RepID=UPI0020090DC0|nr:protein DESIGUAL 3-like [Salvia hispanica]